MVQPAKTGPQPPAPNPTTDEAGSEDNVHIVLRGPDGQIKHEQTVHNLITSAGRNMWVSRLASSPGTAVPTHMAIGTGTNAAAAGDTTLQTELDRNALTSNTASTNIPKASSPFAITSISSDTAN
jgi:hypothetical protein